MAAASAGKTQPFEVVNATRALLVLHVAAKQNNYNLFDASASADTLVVPW
jgi:hypothetical protein